MENIFKNKNILIIGDIMLDSYLFGDVDRISPEAPVPIINVSLKQNKLGGAANVAANIKALGGTPILCSVIGNDSNGKILLSKLKKLKIDSKYIIQSKSRITTNKTRIIGNNHQMIRIDDEITTELDFDDKNLLISSISTILNNNIDCILLQDYDKGILNDTIISTIIIKANKLNIPIIVDPKKRNFSYYNNITLFKPNFKEFKEGLNITNDNKLELLKNGANKLHQRGIEIVVVTLSEDGIFLSYNKGKISKIIQPKSKISVVDVSGAGDTVFSIISMLINIINIEDVLKIANIGGGIVCENFGVTPIDKNILINNIIKYYPSFFKNGKKILNDNNR